MFVANPIRILTKRNSGDGGLTKKDETIDDLQFTRKKNHYYFIGDNKMFVRFRKRQKKLAIHQQ